MVIVTEKASTAGGAQFQTLPARVDPARTVAMHEQPGDTERLGWAVLGSLGAIAGVGAGAAGGGAGGCDGGDC